jgi:hypothetical protein
MGVAGVIERGIAELRLARARPTKISAVRVIFAARTLLRMSASVPWMKLSSGQPTR